MRQIMAKELTVDSFRIFGDYADLLNPTGEKLNPGLVEFYRDMVPLALGAGGAACVSVTQVQPRPFVVEKLEYHTNTGEGFMPLDGDVLVHLAPAGRAGTVPYDRIEAFYVPRGTFVAIRPGVWHQAPFAAHGETVHVQNILPERTYANDCVVVTLEEEHKLTLGFEAEKG